jgi:hypothetical protein
MLAFHSAAAVDDHTIAVFGGEAPDGQPQPDLYLFNTGSLPPPRNLVALSLTRVRVVSCAVVRVVSCRVVSLTNQREAGVEPATRVGGAAVGS